MLEEKSKILDKPQVVREEIVRQEPVKKKKTWVFKIILILIVLGLVYYLFTHTEIIMEPVNKFFGRFS